MLFNSYEFLFLFLPVTLLCYYLLAKRVSTYSSFTWLISASLFFYGWWNPWYVILIIISVLINFHIGKALAVSSEIKTTRSRRTLLVLGITFNLGLLVYYKYANFFVENFNYVFNKNLDIGAIILPLAISFFTFQQIAYLVDAFRGLTKEYRFQHYCLFVTFFPQLIAGPIVHHKEMLPQFESTAAKHFSIANFTIGITIFCIGLFKKVAIADNLAVNVPLTFTAADQGATINFLYAWTASLSYTLQLYFDFSGYSDMAIGIARLFGIILPLNFHSPYKATNIIEFWRRWHMTLSRFLRDYIYIPLGGNRLGYARRYANLMATMLLGGLWHGAGWTFVIWGGLHGVYLIINHGWQYLTTKLFGANRQSIWLTRLLSRSITFLAIVVAWVFFRAESTSGALNIIAGMTGLNGLGTGGHFNIMQAAFIPPALLIVWLLPNTQEIMRRFEPALDFNACKNRAHQPWLSWRPSTSWAIVLGLVFLTVIGSLTQDSEFLYFQF